MPLKHIADFFSKRKSWKAAEISVLSNLSSSIGQFIDGKRLAFICVRDNGSALSPERQYDTRRRKQRQESYFPRGKNQSPPSCRLPSHLLNLVVTKMEIFHRNPNKRNQLFTKQLNEFPNWTALLRPAMSLLRLTIPCHPCSCRPLLLLPPVEQRLR